MDRLTLTLKGYSTTCEDDVDDIPPWKSYGYYMKKAESLKAEGRVCNACAYYATADMYFGAHAGATSDDAIDATIATAFCRIEVSDYPQAAIKDLDGVKDIAQGERLGLILIGLAEAMKRCGRFDNAAYYYDGYLDAFPDGPYAEIAREVRKGLYRFFLTNSTEESGYHVIKQSGGLVFFALRTDDFGRKFL